MEVAGINAAGVFGNAIWLQTKEYKLLFECMIRVSLQMYRNTFVKILANHLARIFTGTGRRFGAGQRGHGMCHRRGYQEWVPYRKLLREATSTQ